MSDPKRRFTEPSLAALGAAIVGFFVFATSGVGQLREDVARWITAGVDRGLFFQAWMEPGIVTLPSPGFEAWAAVANVLFGDGTLFALFVGNALAGAVVIALVSYMGARLVGNWIGGIAAALALISAPPIVVAFTSPGPAGLAYAGFTIATYGLTRDDPGWGTQTVTWIAAALWTLLWPPAIALLAVGWCWRLAADADAPSDITGALRRPGMPLMLAVAPVAVVALITIFPAFWTAPVDRWGAFLYAIVSSSSDPLVYAGTVYQESRPPVWLGPRLLLESLPLSVAVPGIAAALAAWSGLFKRQLSDLRRFLVGALVLALLGPWFARDFDMAATSFLGLAAIPTALLAAELISVLCIDSLRRLQQIFSADIITSSWMNRLSVGLVGLVFAPAALSVSSAHPVSDCWWNSLVGGPQGAAQTGRPVCRYAGIPAGLLSDLPESKLYGGDVGAALTLYERFDMTGSETKVVDSAAGASAIVRRAETLVPGDDQTGDDADALTAPPSRRIREYKLDGLAVWRIDRLAQQIPSARKSSTSGSE